MFALAALAAYETAAKAEEIAPAPTTGALMGGTATATPTDHDLVVGHWGSRRAGSRARRIR